MNKQSFLPIPRIIRILATLILPLIALWQGINMISVSAQETEMLGPIVFHNSFVNASNPKTLAPTQQNTPTFQGTGQSLGNEVTNDVALGDVDGDGDLDAFAANSEPNKIWLNDGHGYFSDSGQLLGDEISEGIALGDLDGDGDLDAFVANREENQIWVNDNGLFTAGQSFTATASNDVALGDLNGDGYLDAVIANGKPVEEAIVNEVWINDSEGTNGIVFVQKEFEGSEETYDQWWLEPMISGAVALADMNQDDCIDVVFVPDGIWLNEKSATGCTGKLNFSDQEIFDDTNLAPDYFRELIQISDDPPMITDAVQFTRTVAGLAIGNIDGDPDGTLDVAVSHVNVYFFSNSGDGTLTYKNNIDFGDAINRHYGIALGEVDSDGDLDVFTTQNGHSRNYIFRNTQSSEFNFVSTNPYASNNSQAIAVGDLNADGRLDAFVATGFEYPAPNEVLLDTSSPFDKDKLSYPGTFYNEGHTGKTGNQAYGNLNGDDLIDAFKVEYCSDDECISNSMIILGEAQDDPTISEQSVFTSTEQIIASYSSYDVSLGDLDDDNDLDAFVTQYWNHPNKVYLNNSQGIFTDSGLDLGRTNGMDTTLADMDSDGDLDAIEYRYNMGTAIWWNQGNLQFEEQMVWWQPSNYSYVDVGDINSDGLLDILISRVNYALKVEKENPEIQDSTPVALNLTLLLNNGNREFKAISINPDLVATIHSGFKDADGDGDIDIVASNDSETFWFKNHRQGSTSQIDNSATLTVAMPISSNGSPIAPTQLITCPIIPVPYMAVEPDNTPLHIRAEFSFSGGGQWFEAKPTDEDTLTDLNAGSDSCRLQDLIDEENIFFWDTSASGFFGESNNVVLRLIAQPQPPEAYPPGTFRYNNQVAGPYQAAPSVTTSKPFRVRGTQIQIFHETLDQPAIGAAAYLLQAGEQTAHLMGNPAQKRIFTTDQTGFLNGRDSVQPGDKLFATLPISQAYRIPPQLIFDGSGMAEVISPSLPVSGNFTIELWLLPHSDTGTLFSIGEEGLSLSYATLTETTAVSLTISNKTISHTLPLHNGQPHHFAVSWHNGGKTANLYNDGNLVISDLSITESVTLTAPIRFGQGFAGTIDDIRLWSTVRNPEQISNTRFLPLSGTEYRLAGYWPVDYTDQGNIADRTSNGYEMTLHGGTAVGYKPLYTIYHTSGKISPTSGITATDYITDLVNGVQFDAVKKSGVQQLIVSKENPLVLFDLDVSLEWDARNDTDFLLALHESFQDASALLYDVTNGQVALGQINLFHNKAYWGVSDIAILADNSLRPSAAIGGVVNTPTDDPDLLPGQATYLPGQIRMGTSWDPYGETTADLGIDWSRALAHETAHYTLFLFDNYLGIENDIVHRVHCPGSFMTSTSDPSYSEFLTRKDWDKGDCEKTLAQQITGRTDWETIHTFYPAITATQTIEGPSDQPLAFTYILPWAFTGQELPFPARNFDIRALENGERLRLPNAQAYLIKTQGTISSTNKEDFSYLTDDQLIILGSPTGGGDRLDVRGATTDDKLCLFDSLLGYVGCIDRINRNTVAIPAAPIPSSLAWQPDISAYAIDATTVAITVNQQLTNGDQLLVQLFPMHYGAIPGNAPVASFDFADNQTGIYTTVLSMKLPAFETVVRVWVKSDDNCIESINDGFTCLREAVTTFRLNPAKWELTKNLTNQQIHNSLIYAPMVLRPDTTAIGGPDTTAIGGPDTTAIGGPDTTAIGGPDTTAIGGPDTTAIGGPDTTAIGGAGRVLLGNPDTTAIGGAGAVFIGNPDTTAIGGPDTTAIGGAMTILLGNPDTTAIGGAELLGNPNPVTIGGGSQHANSPILSADAQVTIYNQKNIFDTNGVESLQALATVPYHESHPWLIPVGQAYEIKLSEDKLKRFISFIYLQHDVPEGYENTLAIYFLPEGEETWIRHENSIGYVENLIVTELDERDGIYAVMATIPMPTLEAGRWNLIAYPLPDCRTVTDTLASLGDRVDGLVEARSYDPASALLFNLLLEDNNSIAIETLEPNHVYWIHITPGENITPYLAPPVKSPDGDYGQCP